ncbi:MAG: hypothetical protein D6719_08955 [Candidatus Dadabacteria bacterium]|nr:MAG: hypothetical protein D6719_08955 [Candidatus Dadabacteria bacterium]
MNISKETRERLQKRLREVTQWLNEHVLRYRPREEITLFDFNINPAQLDGSFKVKFDGEVCPMLFRFSYGNTGNVDVYFPLFVSPLGVPASYGAVSIPKHCEDAIIEAMRKNFPSIKPYGRNQQTGEVIGNHTSLKDRFYKDTDMQTLLERFSNPAFEIRIPLSHNP